MSPPSTLLPPLQELAALEESGALPGYRASRLEQLQSDAAMLICNLQGVGAEGASQDTGVGLFAAAAALNHSCRPNCHTVTMGACAGLAEIRTPSCWLSCPLGLVPSPWAGFVPAWSWLGMVCSPKGLTNCLDSVPSATRGVPPGRPAPAPPPPPPSSFIIRASRRLSTACCRPDHVRAHHH